MSDCCCRCLVSTSSMKRLYALLVFVPITAGLMVLLDEMLTADATAPPPAATTVSSAVASASSAIATASLAIATASSAIATASSAIATASSAITTDPSAAAVDMIACNDDTADLCDTTTAAASTSTATSGDTSGITSAAASDVAGDDGDCSTVASALRLGHGADDSPALQVDHDRGDTGRSLDIADPRGRVDGFDRVVARPRTVGLKMIEKIVLTAVSMFFEKLELAVYLSLYKLKLLYTTLIVPVLGV